MGTIKIKDDGRLPIWFVFTALGIIIGTSIVAVGVADNLGLIRHDPQEILQNITYPQYVCANLDNGTDTFVAVFTQKRWMENAMQAKIPNMYPGLVEVRTNDSRGVMCGMPIEVCDYMNNYCMLMTMIVPVNYTQWETWRSESGVEKWS